MTGGAPYHSVLTSHIEFILQLRNAGETWVSVAAQLREQQGIQTTPRNIAGFWKRLLRRTNRAKRINRPLTAARFQAPVPARRANRPAPSSPAPIPDAFRPRPVVQTSAAPAGGEATPMPQPFTRVGDVLT